MFRILLLLFSIFMSVSAQAQQSLDISFSMNDFNIITNEGVSTIVTNLKNRRVCGDSISPDLPYFFYRIPLQQGQEDISVNVSYTDSLLFENISMIPNPKPSIRKGKALKGGVSRTATKSVVSPLHYSGVKYQNGKGYLLLKITPFLYDAKTRRLNFVKNVHLSFYGIPVGQDVNPVSIHEALNTTSLTYDLSGVPNDRTDNDTIDYLIITSSSLASSFNQLAQWKRSKCLRTKIVTTDSIYAHYSQYNNNQAKIKAFILDYASPTRMKWVLLGGDDSIVPTKFCSNRFALYGAIPADWYYSCYDDDPTLSWNTNNNRVSGEIGDSLDYTPCVYLSRLPVRSNEEVAYYTEKLIDYENGININKKMLLAGYGLDYFSIEGKSDSQYFSEKIYNEFVHNHWNGEIKKLFDTESDYDPLYINGDNLKSVIDSCFNVIYELSHGEPTFWEVSSNSLELYKCPHAESQTNSPGSIIVTGACMTNAFDLDEPCLSESFIRKSNGGAVAYFGCSRTAWGGEHITTTGNNIPLAWVDIYDGYFLQYLFDGTPTDSSHSIAAIATEAKTTVYNEFGEENGIIDSLYHYHLLSMNIMGEPEMPVWTDTIHSFTSNGPGSGPYIVHSMMGGGINVISPVGGCTIAVLDEHGARQVVTNTNSASFSGLDGQTNVAILKQNYIPYLTTTNVSSGGLSPFFLAIHASTTGRQFLDIHLEEQLTEFDIIPSSDNSSDRWQLVIADVLMGETKLMQMVNSYDCRINTSGWPSGMYVIHAYKNGCSTSTKLFIQ